MPKTTQAPQRKNWMFTIFKGKLSGKMEGKELVDWEKEIREKVPNGVKFLVFQQEIAPTTGELHIQGFVAMQQQKRPTALAPLFHCIPESFQKSNGSASSNRGYCTDDDKRAPNCEPFEWGDVPRGQGERTDLEAVELIIKKGRGTTKVIEKELATFVKYPRGIEIAAQHYIKKRIKARPKINVQAFCLYGDSRCGKSHWATEFDPEDSFEVTDLKRGERLNIDGYNGERTLIIQDYHGEIPYGSFKRMFDGTGTQFNTKGGYAYSEWEFIVITSNDHPKDWYPTERGDIWSSVESLAMGAAIGPIQARLTNIVELRGRWRAPTDENPTNGVTYYISVNAGAPYNITDQWGRYGPPSLQDMLPQSAEDSPESPHAPEAASAPASPAPVQLEDDFKIDEELDDLLKELKVLPTPPPLTPPSEVDLTMDDGLAFDSEGFIDDADFEGTLLEAHHDWDQLQNPYEDLEAGVEDQ